MTDLFDDAQQLEQEMRERALCNRHRGEPLEPPDEDAQGNRFCLDCGEQISSGRRQALPEAVRCVECQGWTEMKRRQLHGA